MPVMRSLRSVAAGLAALTVAGAGLLFSGGAGAEPTPSQRLFERTLLQDERTTSAIKGLLRSGGFVAPDITFADVTGDGRTDALALVETGGAAGAVALYVLSTHGEAEDSELRSVYRSQRLHRAVARIDGGALVLRMPSYREGEDLCCPARIRERVYTWSERAQTLQRRSSREVAAPRVD